MAPVTPSVPGHETFLTFVEPVTVTSPLSPDEPLTTMLPAVALPLAVKSVVVVEPLTVREVAAAVPRFSRLRTLPVRTMGAVAEIVDCEPVAAMVV